MTIKKYVIVFVNFDFLAAYFGGFLFGYFMEKKSDIVQITMPTIDLSYSKIKLSQVDQIQFLSDIHLNINYGFSCQPPKNGLSTGLIIAGDLTTAKDSDLFDKFLFEIYKSYTWILFILGNHDYWGSSLTKAKDSFDFMTNSYENVYLMTDRKVFYLDDKVLFGDTFWTNMGNHDISAMTMWNKIMSDSVYIDSEISSGALTVEEMIIEFYSSKKRLEYVLSEHPDSNFLIVSHMAPSIKSVSRKYLPSIDQTQRQVEIYRSMNFYYHSDLEDFIRENPRILYWLHGHSHTTSSYKIGNTEILCNPKGYHKENPVFKNREAIISI